MTEDDWDILYRWNNDPEVLYYAEGDDVSARCLEEVQHIYRTVSQEAFCFIVEYDGQPIGECWLQKMNLPHILKRHPNTDCRRIDLVIGEKQFWGRGIGTRVICLLTKFGFEREGADRVYGEVDSHNPRSKRAFEKVGYLVESVVEYPPGGKAQRGYDMVITGEVWRRSASSNDDER